MKIQVYQSRIVQKLLVFSTILMTALCELSTQNAQANWKLDTSQEDDSTLDGWEKISETNIITPDKPTWELIERDGSKETLTPEVKWIIINENSNFDNSTFEILPNKHFATPSTLEEAEILLKNIPIQPTDFEQTHKISHAIPTAGIIGEDEWQSAITVISPFEFASGTGNQNYAIRLDYGFTKNLQLSGFYSQADDPLNAKITGFEIRPANFWEVYGVAARWRLITNNDLSISLNSSLESWKVGSGGSDSRAHNQGDKASPNIFNDSGKRVETQNIVGSMALPLTWRANDKWQFTFAPAISFLPSNQGKGQGGSGEFYGINPYFSTGLLWQPTPKLGITAGIAQPVGSGTNSFNRNLEFQEYLLLREN